MASHSGTLYIGVTNSLIRRVQEHKAWKIEWFSKKYECHKLVYFEYTQYIYNAIEREKELKDWNRKRKEELISTNNPTWKDISSDL
jgi:putative endonuclease